MDSNAPKENTNPIIGTDGDGFVEQRGGDPKHISVALRQVAITLMGRTKPDDIDTKPRQN